MSAGSVSAARLSPAAGPELEPSARSVGWSRLTRPIWAGWALGFGLGALVLGPGLAPGFLLSYDMVFVPSQPFSAALLGLRGGPARAVPSDLVIALAARVLPADFVQKALLLLIFGLACAGAAVLFEAGWRATVGRRAPVLACLVAGVFYTWNPFVAERLLIGQWALLLGYAGLPWVLREVCTGPVRIKPARLLLMLLPAAVGGFAAMTVSGLAIVGAALTRGTWRERWLRLRTSLLVLGVLSLPWLIPSMINPVHTSPMAVNLFAARADTPFGKLGSLVLLSGIWNSQTVPRGYGGGAAVVWLLIVACSLAGYLFRARARRMWPGVGVAGLVGLVIAAIGVTSPTRAVLRDLVAAWPGFAVLRDGQQFVGALALTEAIGLGAAVGWVMTHSEVAAALDDAATPQSRRLEPAAAALAIMAMLAPLLLLPGLAWGLAGRLRPVQYPADWLVARGLIDHDPEAGSVLLLPWAAYRRYQWNNGGEAVYDPWNKLLSREVISNDGLQVGSVALPQESPASIRLSRLLAAPGPLTAPLRAAGVRFVIVDAGPLLRTSRDLLDAAARLPGAQVVLASRDLVVFRLPGTG